VGEGDEAACWASSPVTAYIYIAATTLLHKFFVYYTSAPSMISRHRCWHGSVLVPAPWCTHMYGIPACQVLFTPRKLIDTVLPPPACSARPPIFPVLESPLPPPRVFRAAEAKYEYLIVTKTGANDSVGLITLNRPKALNALCSPLMAELSTVLKGFQDDVSMSSCSRHAHPVIWNFADPQLPTALVPRSSPALTSPSPRSPFAPVTRTTSAR